MVNLDADDLALFALVVESGSFSRASQRCGLPKATVSRRISALEARLGERLLVRTTRRLQITEFGERILEHAQRLLEEVQAATAFAQHRQTTPQGVLRVSAPPDFFIELELVPFLLQFAERHPQVRLELDLSARRVDLIAERFDLAVRIATRLPDDATLVARRLAEQTNGLYASPAYLAHRRVPEAPADLLEHVALRLITSNGEPQPWRLTRGADVWEGLPVGPLAANSMALQRALAAHGMGIAALSDRFAKPLVEQRLLQRVLPQWCLPSMTAWAVIPGRRLLPTRTAAFIETLQAAMATPDPALHQA